MSSEKQFVEKDHAKIYSSYRLDTPTEFIDKIIAFLKEKVPEPLETAADVGCGSGQSTVILAPYFKHVHGLDASSAQIEQARATRSLPNVTYTASPAEELPFSDGSVQLLTCATSMHWFKLDLFLPEVRRVLCDNGVLAIYGYLDMKAELPDPVQAKELDLLFDNYYEMLSPYLLMRHVQMLRDKYRDVQFPFHEVVRCPDVRCSFQGHLSDIVNYASTFSGLQNYRKADSKGAEECIAAFGKRLYAIGAACNYSPDDSITLYRDYQLILCRKSSAV